MIKDIKNIILDLGGVLLSINPVLTVNAISTLTGLSEFDIKREMNSNKIFHWFETGQCSDDEFRRYICRLAGRSLNFREIDDG